MAGSSTWTSVGWVVLWSAISCLVWAVTAFVLAQLAKRNNIVDTLWGLGFCLIAVVSAIVGSALDDGDATRRVVMVVVVLLWGLRLSWHVGRRSAGKGEDPRYSDLLAKTSGHPTAVAVTHIYLPQAVSLFVVSLPVQVAMVERGPVRWIGWLGVLLWAIGLVFEAVGDAQMERFKSDPAHKGKIADVGLWRYTRHPNYFGDAMVWIGIFVIAVDRWPGVVTFFGPALMVYLLANGTGKRLLEKSMKDRPGYREYMERTSGFVPLPHRLHRMPAGSGK